MTKIKKPAAKKQRLWEHVYNFPVVTRPYQMQSLANVTVEMRPDGLVMVDQTVDPPRVTYGPGLAVVHRHKRGRICKGCAAYRAKASNWPPGAVKV